MEDAQIIDGVAAALGCPVVVALIQRHPAGDGGDVRRQRAGPFRRYGVPQTEPHVADALLRVLSVGKYAV